MPTIPTLSPIFRLPDQIMALQQTFWNKLFTVPQWIPQWSPRGRTIHQDADNIGWWVNA
jgi:hypothetical protein